MSSSTPSALSTYDGSRLALVQALPLLTARSCSARAWRQHCWQKVNAEIPPPGLSAPGMGLMLHCSPAAE